MGGTTVGPVEAIQSGFQNYANFSGRAARPAYWWWVLFSIVVSLLAAVVDVVLGSSIITAADTRGVGIVGTIVGLALLLPGLAVLVRRLHDTDRSGWWFFITLIPILGAIVLLVFLAMPGTPGDNRYGPSPSTDLDAASRVRPATSG
jgi:uncharacterized membrane protein YhaH (DUF805 family)